MDDFVNWVAPTGGVSSRESGKGRQETFLMTSGDTKLPMLPTEVRVKSDHPFENDLLDRSRFVATLTNIIGRLESPCVIAIDGEWGSGKTTLLKMSAVHLRNNGFHVAWFNAWENDFASSPFQVLSAEIPESLGEHGGEEITAIVQDIKKVAVPVAFGLAKMAAGVLVPGSTALVEAVEKLITDDERSDPISDYLKLKRDIQAFRASLEAVAAELSGQAEGKPIVIAIDELDRCRPSYAVELLEIAKHIFMTPNVIFVLAINTSELEKSVRSLYGSDFDAERYLRRFFNLSIRVPTHDLGSFAENKLSATGLNRSQRLLDTPLTLLELFASESASSPRDVEQLIYQINLICAMAPRLIDGWQICMVIALILRTADPVEFNRLIRGTADERAIIDVVFDNIPIDRIETSRIKTFVESTIIAGSSPRPGLRIAGTEMEPPLSRTSPGYAEHEEIFDATGGQPDAKSLYSRGVLSLSGQIWRGFGAGDQRPALVEAAHLIELLVR